MANSIIQDDKQCIICGSQYQLEYHHIFMGANRKISDANGFTCWLCNSCHTGSNDAVHGKYGHDNDLMLKQMAQQAYEDLGHTTEQFRQIIGKSYL